MKASLVAQRLKRLPPMRETWVRSLGWEDSLEKEMAIHSSILAWRILWTEKPSRLQSTGSQRVGHDWATSPSSGRPGVPSISDSPDTEILLWTTCKWMYIGSHLSQTLGEMLVPTSSQLLALIRTVMIISEGFSCIRHLPAWSHSAVLPWELVFIIIPIIERKTLRLMTVCWGRLIWCWHTLAALPNINQH